MKRIVSIYLSVCLILVLVLSSNFEAQAMAVVISTPSDSTPLDPEEIESLAEDAAYSLDDIDSLVLESLPKERIDSILSHANDPVQEFPVVTNSNFDNGIFCFNNAVSPRCC